MQTHPSHFCKSSCKRFEKLNAPAHFGCRVCECVCKCNKILVSVAGTNCVEGKVYGRLAPINAHLNKLLTKSFRFCARTIENA